MRRNLVKIRPCFPCVPHPSLNDQFYKGFCPKITIFINFFFVFVITFYRIHLFHNRFHWWSTFWPFFLWTHKKVMFMAIVGKAIMAILTIKSIMATLAPILNDHKYELCGCLKKEWPKCISPVKMVMKKLKSYDENKKKLITSWGWAVPSSGQIKLTTA